MVCRAMLPTLLLLAASGCATDPMGVDFAADRSTVPDPEVRLPLPVRVGVRLPGTKHAGLHELVVQMLKESGNFAQVRATYTREQAEGLDYEAVFSYKVETGARWFNAFIMFPGFVVLAHHWVYLRWELDVETTVVLLRPDGTEVGRWSRTDGHDVAYTSPGYSVAANVGFAGILFLPAVGAPLVGGVVASAHQRQPIDYLRRFYQSAAGRGWAHRVTNLLAARVEADLSSARRVPRAGGSADAPAEEDAALDRALSTGKAARPAEPERRPAAPAADPLAPQPAKGKPAAQAPAGAAPTR